MSTYESYGSYDQSVHLHVSLWYFIAKQISLVFFKRSSLWEVRKNLGWDWDSNR